jgi:hypothetical protein
MAPAAVRRPGRAPARAGVPLLVVLVCLMLHALCAPVPAPSPPDRGEAPVAGPEVPGGDSHDHPEPMSRRRAAQTASLPHTAAAAVDAVSTGTVSEPSRLPAPACPPWPLRTVLRC